MDQCSVNQCLHWARRQYGHSGETQGWNGVEERVIWAVGYIQQLKVLLASSSEICQWVSTVCWWDHNTQPDGTVFFLIFTYLRGRSHWNSRDYGSNVAICHFLKPATNKGDFRLYFLLVEKSCRGRHHSEILKTNTKTLISSIYMWAQGPHWCQKMRQDPLNMPFEVWCAKIAPKLKNIGKSLRKQGLSFFLYLLRLK